MPNTIKSLPFSDGSERKANQKNKNRGKKQTSNKLKQTSNCKAVKKKRLKIRMVLKS